MKVIGAGFGRTGTMSLQAALEELGFGPCYHMQEVFKNPRDAVIWNDGAVGRAVDWKEFMKNYQATVDWPGCTFYKELMVVYPEAKVLLSVRPFEKWYESATDTIYAISRTPLARWFSRLIPPMARFMRMTDNLIWIGTFGGRFSDKAHARKVYEAHIEEVKRHVPPDRLLVFEVKDGWGPLCQFLNVPVPSTDFPRLNDTAQFQKRIRIMKLIPVLGLGVVLLLILAILFV